MKTAVVFCGPIRGFELASKCWHIYGDADYFIITWDRFGLQPWTDLSRLEVETSLANFPVTVKHTIISDIEPRIDEFSKCLNDGTKNISNALMFYNWSLVETLPGIKEYNRIIITRSDALVYDEHSVLKTMQPDDGQILFGLHKIKPSWAEDFMINAHPTALPFISSLLSQFTTSGLLIHYFLGDLLLSNHPNILIPNEQIRQLRHALIRPGYPAEWINEPYSKDLCRKLIDYWEQWEIEHD